MAKRKRSTEEDDAQRVSIVRTEDVLAVLCGDLHLSLNPPVARAKEPSWFTAMGRPLQELRTLQSKYECPILCAGDVFDSWKAPAELINWALDNLPEMWSIPGQHDMPLHNLEQMNRSAYQTLVKAGKLKRWCSQVLEYNHKRPMLVQGFPWGCPVSTPPAASPKGALRVAVIHQYVWTSHHCYPGAPEAFQLSSMASKLDGWDVAVFGDNHKGFTASAGTTRVFNCGTLMRRKTDEWGYHPQVGLLLEDGSIVPHRLNTDSDVLEVGDKVEKDEDLATMCELGAFMDELKGLQQTELDFTEALKHAMNKFGVRPAVRKIILEAQSNG